MDALLWKDIINQCVYTGSKSNFLLSLCYKRETCIWCWKYCLLEEDSTSRLFRCTHSSLHKPFPPLFKLDRKSTCQQYHEKAAEGTHSLTLIKLRCLFTAVRSYYRKCFCNKQWSLRGILFPVSTLYNLHQYNAWLSACFSHCKATM